MREQAISTSLFNKLLDSLLLAVVGFCLSINANAKQTVLLDVNGKPLSEKTLLLLSTAPGTLNSLKTPKVTVKSQTKVKTNKHSPNPLLEQELFDAVKTGQVQRVSQLLRAGVAPKFKNYKGETPLGIAVSHGWATMVIELINNGANINEKGARGITLLHVASAKGLTDVAKVLVKSGLNPSQRTDKNWTSLHVAARYGHWKLVQYYVSEGVDPNIRNSDGRTALELAKHLHHQGIIKILTRVTNNRSLSFAELNLKKK